METAAFATRWGFTKRAVRYWIEKKLIKARKTKGVYKITDLAAADKFVTDTYQWFELNKVCRYKEGDYTIPRDTVSGAGIELIDEVIEDYDGSQWIRVMSRKAEREEPSWMFERGIVEKQYSIVDRKSLVMLISRSLRNEGLSTKADALESLEL